MRAMIIQPLLKVRGIANYEALARFVHLSETITTKLQVALNMCHKANGSMMLVGVHQFFVILLDRMFAVPSVPQPLKTPESSASYRAVGFYIDKFELENWDVQNSKESQKKKLPIRTFRDIWLRKMIKIKLNNPASALQPNQDQQKYFDLGRLAQGAAELVTLPEKPKFTLLPLFYIGREECKFDCKLMHVLFRELAVLQSQLASDLEPAEVNMALLHRTISLLVFIKKLNVL